MRGACVLSCLPIRRRKGGEAQAGSIASLPSLNASALVPAGRVPAMFNGCVGVKPTVGRLPTTGVVPACRTLDCVTVFAQNVADGAAVTRLMEVPTLRTLC